MAKLLKRKHKQKDMFICDILDATPKDDIGTMEHPFFSLSKNPDREIKYYEHNEEYIKITPSVLGMATIFDKDILIFAMSQIMAKINQGEKPSQIIHFSAYDLLVSTDRSTSGAQYQRLKSAFKRLEGTRIETCIRAGGEEITHGFGLIDYWKIIRETSKGRMEGLELKISDWLYKSLLSKEVLSISNDYFRLGKPIERRLYEICRKHCGKQQSFKIKLEALHKKVGSTAQLRRFRGAIKAIAEDNYLPDYTIKFHKDQDMLIINPRNLNNQITSLLKSQTYETASKILEPYGIDKYSIESEWKEWIKDKTSPQNPDGAFIGFCKMKVANI